MKEWEEVGGIGSADHMKEYVEAIFDAVIALRNSDSRNGPVSELVQSVYYHMLQVLGADKARLHEFLSSGEQGHGLLSDWPEAPFDVEQLDLKKLES